MRGARLWLGRGGGVGGGVRGDCWWGRDLDFFLCLGLGSGLDIEFGLEGYLLSAACAWVLRPL